MTIKVPATSANMGPGFDSLGIAVNLYLEVDVVCETDKWEIEHSIPYLPKDERNLIIRTALRLEPNLKPYRLRMRTDIPTTRGLGSSSSAIVAGIELANYLGNLKLSKDAKIQLANRFEGHPDNVAPAIIGNMVVSGQSNQRVFWSKIKLHHIDLVACVPATPLATKKSRGVLPETISLAQAAEGSAMSNVLIAQLSRGYLKNVRHVIERDVFHEPFRQHLVPELLRIREILKLEYTYGTYLSGAGPTVMTLVPVDKAETIQKKLKQEFPEHDIFHLSIDCKGAHIIKHD
ncbi:homoserine kinase [Granulicatella sp. 19428wC4_WM01]|nr:homoserine kinase [Granulicatella sp. 19428wC4_WM01]TFU91591.1 homoserine kinase [Granulicatella sp. WM01]